VPREPAVARLLQIRADPLAHFLPTTAGRDGAPAMLCAAPPGVQLAPELSALFMRPVRGPAQHKRRAGADKDAAPASAKKARVGSADAEGEEEIEDPEVARRGSVAPSVRSDLVPGSVGGFDLGAGFDDSAALDSFQLDVPDAPFPEAEMELPPARERSQSALPPSERARSRSRLSTPGVAFEDEGVAGADAACPIASFDARSSQSQQSQLPADLPDVREDGKGYSKNTIKALQMIRRELEPAADAGDEEEKTMSFSTMADKVTFPLLT
jgi:cohesin complex subunit SCC1